jgi:hypothetical protein
MCKPRHWMLLFLALEWSRTTKSYTVLLCSIFLLVIAGARCWKYSSSWLLDTVHDGVLGAFVDTHDDGLFLCSI